jgi:hypothetical protein
VTFRRSAKPVPPCPHRRCWEQKQEHRRVRTMSQFGNMKWSARRTDSSHLCAAQAPSQDGAPGFLLTFACKTSRAHSICALAPALCDPSCSSFSSVWCARLRKNTGTNSLRTDNEPRPASTLKARLNSCALGYAMLLQHEFWLAHAFRRPAAHSLLRHVLPQPLRTSSQVGLRD